MLNIYCFNANKAIKALFRILPPRFEYPKDQVATLETDVTNIPITIHFVQLLMAIFRILPHCSGTIFLNYSCHQWYLKNSNFTDIR